MKRMTSVFLLAVAVGGGCAHLDYVKIPTPTQYSVWTDDDQRVADGMKGVRYYLPRPFLHVKQSVPVAQRVAFVSFTYKEADPKANRPAGYYFDAEDAPTWVRHVVPKFISSEQALAAMSPKPRGSQGELQGGDLGGPNTAPPAPSPAPEPPSTLHSRNGFINESDPVTRLSPLMDVVYLPDFDEQYIIQAHGGLGKVDVETRLRNGWAAEVFSQEWNNANLIPYVIDQVEHTSEAAAGIFTTWAPLFAGLPPAKLPGTTEALQSGELEDKALHVLGDLLVFKIGEVKVAQPGIYPILKPREIRDWFRGEVLSAGRDAEETFELFLRENNLPWIRPDMAFVPCPPVTVVGFNVTTDLFFMPVTERLTAETSAGKEDQKPGAGNGAIITTLEEERLRARLDAWFTTKITAKDLSGVTIGGAFASASDTGNSQHDYVLQYNLQVDPAEAENVAKTVNAALLANVPEGVDRTKLGATLSPDKKTLTLSIPGRNLKELLESKTWMVAAG